MTLENGMEDDYAEEDTEYIEMEGNHIVDAAKVVKNAVRNAINLAGIILTTGVVINLPEKSFEERQLEIMSNKRSPF